jgi:hypothetical protein
MHVREFRTPPCNLAPIPPFFNDMEERLGKSQSLASSLVISFFFQFYITKMKFTKTPPSEVFNNLKCTKNPRSHYCPSISGAISVGEFVYLSPATTLEHLGSKYDRFNNRAPQGMLVQTDLVIEGCLMEETVGSGMVISMDHYARLVEGLLNVYFIDSVYQPMNLCIMMKSCNFHFRSSSDLFRKAFVSFVSHPELQYNHLVKVYDNVCKMIERVATGQQWTHRFHIDMLPSVWIMIKRYLLEEINEKRLGIYYDNDVIVHTVKRGVFITPDKRIQLTTVEQ